MHLFVAQWYLTKSAGSSDRLLFHSSCARLRASYNEWLARRASFSAAVGFFWGHNRPRRPDRRSPSKFPIVAQTCLVPLETFDRIFERLPHVLPTTQRKHVTLPVSPNLKKNCSPRVHSRSEAVESRESKTFSGSIQIPSVAKTFLSNSQYPLSCISPSSWDWAQAPSKCVLCVPFSLSRFTKCHPCTPASRSISSNCFVENRGC